MKIINVTSLVIEDIKVIRFARFCDHRGYFAEPFRATDLMRNSGIKSLAKTEFVQANESISKSGVIRGLHFQWNPYMGKLVRTLHGHMVDIILDIRKGSPTFGKAIMYDMPANLMNDFDEWIWVPPGFAHGNYFLTESRIEYFCTGEYSQGCEAGISPAAEDIDWTLCETGLKNGFDQIYQSAIITDKDRNAQSLGEWTQKEDSNHFVWSDLRNDGWNE